MLDFLEYNDVFKEDRGALSQGRIKMTNQAIVFKNSKTGKVEQVAGNDIEHINWQRMSNGFGLRILAKNGNLLRYGGFVESDFEKLSKFFEHNFSTRLQLKEFSMKGWNWGQANFFGSVLSFDTGQNNTAFEIPLSNVSHCTSAKNEVTLEFHQNDDATVSLMELRFHIPTQADGLVDDPVQAFTDAVLNKASIIQATGDAVAVFSELQCLTPRGRYDIKLFPTFIQLHGKTFDYKIPITTILRLFRLPHKDTRQVFFVLSLDPPIKQGQTRYHFLILLFNKDDEVNLEITVSDKEFQERYEGKLERVMSGSTVDVLGQVMKVVVQRKVTTPAPLGSSSTSAITCSYRAGAGLLYPLERGFIYVHKPPVHIRFDEISSINFARSGGSTRSFDFEVETRSGIVHTFSSIEKEEYSKLFDFVSSKKLRVKNRGTEPTAPAQNDDLVDSDVDDEPDAYLHRVQQEARDREVGDDSDESDESFNPGEEGSDVAEEYDSNASASPSSSDEDASDSEKKKKKERKEKERREKEKAKEKKKSKEKKKESSRKSKKNRDENKPKKPMSAYFLWLNENRERLKKEHPGLSLTELTKKAAEIWREIKDKTKWDKEAAEAKKKYERDMAEYRESGGGAAGGDGQSSAANEGKEKKKKKSSSKEAKKSPVKSSGTFKSKEYIDDDDSSSSDSDESEKRKSKKKKKKGSSDESESD